MSDMTIDEFYEHCEKHDIKLNASYLVAVQEKQTQNYLDKIERLQAEVERLKAELYPLQTSVRKNEYGLDVHYIHKWLLRVVRDVDRYTPDEMHTELSRMAKAVRYE